MKLDIGLIKDIHQDTIKYAMVKSMVEFANLTNIALIAEGIENEEDLRTLIKLGVHNGQGYFLRVPSEEFKSIQPEAMEIIRKVQSKKSVRSKIQSGIDKEYRVILFKIGSYKALRAYRQKYGEEQGDEILKMMRCVVDENLSKIETMAMVDEETIVSVLEKENSRIKCEIIANKFRTRLKSYYNDKDWKAGYIECMNKHDEIRKCPLLDICVERLV